MVNTNAQNVAQLVQSLSQVYCFADLDSRITECISLADDCDAIGIDLAELAAPLDAAAAGVEAEEATERHAKRQRPAAADAFPGERGPVIDLAGLEPQLAVMILTCAGRYCALLGHHALAAGHFRAALAAGPPAALPAAVGPSAGYLPACVAAEAHLGLAQAALMLGHRSQAATLAISFWRNPNSISAAASSRAHMHLAFLLHALSAEQPAAPPDALVLLRRLSPLLATPACSAVEGLAASWLPSQVPAAVRGGGEHSLLSEPFVQAALAGSRTFGSLELEPLVCAARRQLLYLLLRGTNVEGMACGAMGGGWGLGGVTLAGSGGSEATRLQRIEAASAVASWALFVDYCLEETPAETQAVTLACGAIEAGLSAAQTSDWPLSLPDQLAYLAAAAMYQDLSQLRAVELWLRGAPTSPVHAPARARTRPHARPAKQPPKRC